MFFTNTTLDSRLLLQRGTFFVVPADPDERRYHELMEFAGRTWTQVLSWNYTNYTIIDLREPMDVSWLSDDGIDHNGYRRRSLCTPFTPLRNP